MNLTTERIENHRAQLTVEIESDVLEDAKRKAARKISRQVRIKGFRKGKAPYRLVAQAVGEGAILEEAVETLGDNLYKKALEEAEVLPYGPGAFDDFQLEPSPTFVFSVPLQPEVDLNAYQDIRVDFEAPEVSDYDVDQALKQLQQRAVEVLDDSVAVAAPGNRVTIAVESEFVDGEPQDAVADDDDEADASDALTDDSVEDTEPDQQAPYIPKQGDTFVSDENATIILDPNEDPFTHGFVGHLIGLEQGASVGFELTIPDDDADETIIGRRVEFHVTMNKIESISIPELDDDFARRVSRNRGDLELDLAGLRASTRDELERSALSQAKSEYCNQVLERMVEGAEIVYPDVMLDQQIDGMVGEFERNLQQQRISLDDYYRLTSSTKDDLREQHRESAANSLRHSLVLREFVSAQDITISDEDIAARLDAMVAGYGAGPEIRKLFDTPQMRDNIRNDLVMSQANEHLYAIGRGEDPAAAVEAMRAQVADDAQRAQERSERLLKFQAEDEAAAAALAGDERTVQSLTATDKTKTESEVDEAGDAEQAQEA
ncbi:MAG: trigger factor [Anaerolineae bacterium]|nr:trigger factor [Anaerolineae bacterium]